MVQERSLAQYLAPIRTHSALILCLALFALIASLIVWARSLQTLPYQAEAIIMFRPNNGGQLNVNTAQFSNTSIDFVRQQQNVALLAASMDIATKVQQAATASADPDVRALAAGGALGLHDKINIQTKGSFLAVTANAPTASAATWLANKWANQAVEWVNAIYASPSPNVQQAIDDVKAQLDKDQAALERFLTDNPISGLQAEMTSTVGFIQSATGSRLSSDYLLFDAQRQATRDQITDSYKTQGILDQQLTQLAALRAKIQNGPDDQGTLLGNQVALLTIMDKVVSGDSQAQIQLQLNIADLGKGALTRSSQLSDVDATIAALQKMQADVRAKIASLEQKLLSSIDDPTPLPTDDSSPVLRQYNDKLNELQSQIEANTFELGQLTKARDQDQTTYDLLRGRLAEQQVNQLVSGIIDVGASANEAQTLQSRSTLRSLALVAGQWVLIAIAIGLGLAYLLNAIRPTFNSNALLTNRFRRKAASGEQRAASSE